MPDLRGHGRNRGWRRGVAPDFLHVLSSLSLVWGVTSSSTAISVFLVLRWSPCLASSSMEFSPTSVLREDGWLNLPCKRPGLRKLIGSRTQVSLSDWFFRSATSDSCSLSRCGRNLRSCQPPSQCGPSVGMSFPVKARSYQPTHWQLRKCL